MAKKKNRRRNYHSKMWRGGTMKSMPFIILGFVLIFGFYGISKYVEANKQTWAMQAQIEQYQKQRLFEEQLKKEQADAEWWAKNGWLVTGTFYSLILVVPATAAGYAMWHLRNKRIEQSYRQINGSYALQWRTVGGVKTLIDPNKLAGGIGALTVDNVLGSKPYFDNPEQQLRLLEQENKKRLIQAMPEQSIRYAAAGKFLAGAYDKPQRQLEYHVAEEDEEIEPQPIVRYDLTKAISESTDDTWYVGQNPDDGHLYNLNINDVVHVGLVGATKTGKTSSTALLMMFYALRNKFLVIAFDGAGGVDWLPYKDYIEVYPVDYTTLPERVNQIVEIHEKRMRKLQKLDAANIDEVKGMKVPHILVIFEEFGYMCQALESADKKLFKETESKLSNLMRVSRKTGISFLLIDQNPARWSQVIKANVKLFIAYKLNGNLGGAINEYHLDKLKNKGQCSIESTVYDTWFTKGEINKLLIDIPKRSGALLGENVTVNDKGGGGNTIIDVKPTPQLVTVNTVNTPVTTVNRTENAGNKTVNTDNTVNEPFTLNRAPLTQDEKDKVYQIYLETGKAKNETCRRIWNVPKGKSAGGYLKYLNAVIEEKEVNND